MGKATGFLEYERVENPGQEPLERIDLSGISYTTESGRTAETGCTLYGLRCSILSERKANHGHGVRLSAEQPLSGVERTGL